MAEVILALDVQDRERACTLARSLAPVLSWCKIGLEMFTLCGPSLVRELQEMGYHIFLDLKFYDIPNTVHRAVQSCAKLNVELLTLHLQGGRRMLEEAVRSVQECTQKGLNAPKLFGVTVLTSFGEGEIPGIAKTPTVFAAELAELAAATGLNGVVCSAHEVQRIKHAHPSLQCLCPGIRPAWADAQDQKRVATPQEAVRLGADLLVIGRPITQARDPLRAAQKILAELG